MFEFNSDEDINESESESEFKVSEDSENIKNSLFSMNKDINTSISSDESFDELPKGNIFEDAIEKNVPFDKNKKIEYALPDLFRDGRHKKKCQCRECLINRGETIVTTNDKGEKEILKNKNGEPVKVKQKHNEDILTQLWESNIFVVCSLVFKIPLRDLLFSADEKRMLKNVQPDNDLLSTKNWIIYGILLISMSIQKVLIGRNPFIKEHWESIKEEAKNKVLNKD